MHLRSISIPAAGLGTRLLPATKAVSEDLLNVYERLVVQFAIDEEIEAGAERIIVMIPPGKLAICDYLQPDDTYIAQQSPMKNQPHIARLEVSFAKFVIKSNDFPSAARRLDIQIPAFEGPAP